MSKSFTVPIILPADPTAPMQAATKQYVDASGGGVVLSDLPTMRLYATGTQAVTAGSYIAVAWTEAADSNPQGHFTLVTPTRIRVEQDGQYLVTYLHRWSGITAGSTMHSELRMNSAEDSGTGGRLVLGQTITGGGTGAKFGSTDKIVYLVAGDYINNFAHNADSASRNLDGGAESNSSLSIVALVGTKGDKGDVGSGSTVTVQEEAVSVGNRPTINFVGNRLIAADDAANNRVAVTADDFIVAYKGAWSSATAYVRHDVVYHFSAWWIWTGGTPPAASDEPGVGNNTWRLFSGPPLMTAAQITAWTGPLAGSTVFNDDTNRLLVRADAQWRASYPLSYGNQFALNTVAAATNDATVRNIFTSAALVYGGLLTVNGRVDVQMAGTGNTEMRVEGYLFRGGSSIGTIATTAARHTFSVVGGYSIPFNWQWYSALPGDEVQITIKRQSGTMTYGCTVATSNWHGVQIIEQPN